MTLHGALIRIFETGVLFTGPAGIGKSECGLELLSRGHQLVADDAVEVQDDGGRLVGRAPYVTQGVIYIRGLGCVDIKKVFGAPALAESSPVDLVIELVERRSADAGSKLHADFRDSDLLGHRVPSLSLPVRPGQNLAVLVETAVRLHRLLQSEGDPAEELIARHRASVQSD